MAGPTGILITGVHRIRVCRNSAMREKPTHRVFKYVRVQRPRARGKGQDARCGEGWWVVLGAA